MSENADRKSQAALLSVSKKASMPTRGRCTSTPMVARRALLGVSENASILLAGRCTSTPIGPNRLSFSRLGASDMLDLSHESGPTTRMDDSSVPVFGRQNLKSLSDRQRRADVSGIRKILPERKSRQPALTNVEKTFDDRSGKIAEASSTARRQLKRGTNGNVVANKRRSMHNDSRGPIFKVTPKVPKSPRLLTAIRAKQRALREKAKNAEIVMQLEAKKTDKKQEICAKPIRPLPKISPTTFNKYKITIPVSPKTKKTKKSLKM